MQIFNLYLGVELFAEMSSQPDDWQEKNQADYLAERLEKLELDNENLSKF